MAQRTAKGFTIVEIMIVLVILGILAGITYVAVGDWRIRSATNEVKNDLTAALAEIENARNFNNIYPDSLWDVYHDASPNVTMWYGRRGDGTFCVDGISKVAPSVKWHVDSRIDMTLKEGECT